MVRATFAAASVALAAVARASCPWTDPQSHTLAARADASSSREHVAQFDVDDGKVYLTSDVGGPIEDQQSLKAGERGSTLLEDFIFRQKITRFDHERVPERAVHARGAGAYGTFTSYGDFRNITAASFLSAKGKKTPTFVRFSTVAGSRGSADTVRDVHGFATRFYTDEGNFDIVGNNIPVFFIQDAIQFPDLIHAVKPKPDNEIPQAATAHDSAWDFFSQQTSTLHTLFWAMAGYGIPRSFRHMDGFGVHTFRFVNDEGESKLIKWHWKTMQGKASLVWDEAQNIAGKNADFHRQDLWDAINSGNFPEWELNVQIIDEKQALDFGFDVLDPTKIIPEELAPLRKVGVMKLDVNPVNYFAETEQIMFQPGHIVRGIDFTEDPLLQGRIFSYLDTQINRHGGPNFEQLPINRPVVPVHNNNRDGAAQNFIHKNTAAYSPNTLNKGSPAQADQKEGKGFFTAPGRKASGFLVRERSATFADHWSQPRLFYNSLTKVEQQFLIDAIRFETSQVAAPVQKNVLAQLNKISHDVAVRVGVALGMEAPAADPTFYHNNKTKGISILGEKLPTIATLKVGVLASIGANDSLSQAKALKAAFEADKVTVVTVAETLAEGVDMTYSAASATGFDGIIVTSGAEKLFGSNSTSTLYPPRRPTQIITDGYNWGKPVGFLGTAQKVGKVAGVGDGEGVYAASKVDAIVEGFREGLAVFKFTDRFATDDGAK
ncbi:catalase domain-containing protein [Hirsutella rhossiliensis]|uniref:Catalase n=1 Tax=Hirsutella rhossiliensis TaxID=111463 RepID=A0A9P8MXA1_9HYPO|nr:catalase domain-containing protein [Hirsutella rhossiliensis]KAH0962950.1 catalase domain-containing protein [Hirsutella rhossiliensis]